MPGAEFHFLRPLWLAALPVLLAALWWLLRRRSHHGGWQRVVDSPLQPHVLDAGSSPPARGRGWLAALALVIGCLALAGPTWEQAPQTTWRSEAPLVIVLDLSRSMDATDVRPSRLERAVLKIRDLLAREPAGKVGLVVYTANAFTVTPLTSDAATVEALLGALATDIMPSQGSFPQLGLERGANLMRQAGLRDGDLLLVTDSAGGSPAREAVERLLRDGYRTSVLAVGTAEGAPIPEPGGGFLRDSRGQVVVPRLQEAPLQRLAGAGGGRYARLSIDDSDLDRLLAPLEQRARQADARETDVEATRWIDRGAWLVPLLLPLALWLFRSPAALPAVVVGALLVGIAPAPAQAADWRALLLPADRRALAALADEDPERAAELFRDREWRAAALYRAGEYPASAEALADVATPRGHYNRGNALARAGDLPAAATAYRSALELAPDMEDARYNLELVEAALQPEPAPGGLPAPDESTRANGEAQAGDRQEAPGEDPAGLPPPGADDAPDADADPSLADDPEDAPDAGEQVLAQASATDPDDLDDADLDEALDQWLRRVRHDPGALLRRKFEYQYRREGRDQDGNPTWPGDEREPW